MSRSIEIDNMTTANIQQLRVINVATLPVTYTAKFYDEILSKNPKEYMKFAFWNGTSVGAVVARLEPHADNGCFKLYIMTLAVLPEYRRKGIASALLDHVLEIAKKDKTIKEVYLHVQVNNEAAKKFYTEGHKFEEAGVVKDYYKKIEPADGYILRKDL